MSRRLPSTAGPGHKERVIVQLHLRLQPQCQPRSPGAPKKEKKTGRSNAESSAAFPNLRTRTRCPVCMGLTPCPMPQAVVLQSLIALAWRPRLLLPEDGRAGERGPPSNKPHRGRGPPPGHASRVLCLLRAWIVHQSLFESTANIEPRYMAIPRPRQSIKAGFPASPPGFLPMFVSYLVPTWQCRQLGSSSTRHFPGRGGHGSGCSLDAPICRSSRVMFLFI